jgi:GT2 family glycosyltransferase
MKTLALIVPAYIPDEPTLAIAHRCLLSMLTHQDTRFQTVIRVVDDGSPYSVQCRDDIRYSEHGRNRGIAVAWNTGWKAEPDADFYAWVNVDCEVTPGWAFPLVAAVEALDCIAMPYTNGVKSEGIGITGWCFVASRETAERIGPFDETFVPARYEDTDWFHRAIYQHKIPLVNVPTANVIHERMMGGTKAMPRMEWLHLAMRFRYGWKHNVDPQLPPPFWRAPLPEVEIEGLNGEHRQLQVPADSNVREHDRDPGVHRGSPAGLHHVG